MADVTLRAEPSYEDTLKITRALRACDFEELNATNYDMSPEYLAHVACATGAFRWGAYVDGRPVALIGAVPRWPNVWSVWAYGTDEWDKVALTLTKHARRFILPALYRSGAVRGDCQALSTHTTARNWLEFLGADLEKELDGWGKNGETFISYVWSRKKMKQIMTKKGLI
jgi:hypothetical protein